MNKSNKCLYALLIIVILNFSVIAVQAEPPLASAKAPSVEEASSAISKIDPNLKVISVQPTPLPEMWELVVELQNKQKTVIYLNSARDLVFVGNLLDLNSRANLTQARQEDLNRVDFASISNEGDLVLGDPSARNKVIVFDDPD